MGKTNDILQNTQVLLKAVEALKRQNDEVLATVQRQGKTAEELAALHRERGELQAQLSGMRGERDALSAEMEKLRREKGKLSDELESLRAQARFMQEQQSRSAAAPASAKTGETASVKVTAAKAAPAVAEDGYLYFGEYPQTVKAANVTVGDVKDSRGYYLGSDGCYYFKAEAKAENMRLSDGTSTVAGFTYYLKVEPIKWKILSKEGGKALLLADRILATSAFQTDYSEGGGRYFTTANGAPKGTYANNYEYSEVRSWLNGELLRMAFTAEQRERILVTNVDNTLQSTCDDKNPYTCKNTSDKIFLLSVKEVTCTAYGFSNSQGDSATRADKEVSDYALVMGARDWWLLRSPSDRGNSAYAQVRCIDRSGWVNENHFGISGGGVAPALQIRL